MPCLKLIPLRSTLLVWCCNNQCAYVSHPPTVISIPFTTVKEKIREARVRARSGKSSASLPATPSSLPPRLLSPPVSLSLPNARIPHVSNAVQLVYTPTLGRHLVVASGATIKAGTVVLVEPAYAFASSAVGGGSGGGLRARCRYCVCALDRPLSCSNCTALYCSDDCVELDKVCRLFT